MPFQKGHKLAKGGARPRSGRPREEWREKLNRLIDKNDILENIVKLATSANSEKVRLSACQWLHEMSYGKAPQPVEHSGEVSGRFVVVAPPDA